MNNKIYIAGRVSGIKYEIAKFNFARAERYWRHKGYEVVNPIKLCKKNGAGGVVWLFCLWNLFKCKYVYFMPNYVYSNGARIELFFAKLLRKKIYFLE